MNSAQPRRALIATHNLVSYAGSEVFTLELATELREMGWEVIVAALLSGEPMAHELEKRGLRVVDILNEPSAFANTKFDLAWVHHGPVFHELFVAHKVEAATVVFCSLSHFEPLEAVPAYAERIDHLLANSFENKNFILHELGLSDENQVVVFPNSVPSSYWGCAKQFHRPALKRLAMVSNHPPPELLDAAVILRRNGVDVTRIGLGGTPALMSPPLLLDYDAVITTGKTIPYCFALRIPVYCYDHFGGPGWLNDNNFDLASRNNFSGRGFEKKAAERIVRELTEDYRQSLGKLDGFANHAENFLDLRKNLTRVLSGPGSALPKQFNINNTKQALKQHAQYIRLIKELNSHQTELGERKKEISRLNKEVSRVKSTFSWRCTAPFRAAFNLALRLLR